MNNVTISGNLTRDCEMRTTANGTCIVTFSIAWNERRKDANGEWGDRANYFDCVWIGKLAAAVAPKLTKGTRIALSGILHMNDWTDRDGQRHTKVEINVQDAEIMPRANQKPQEPQTDADADTSPYDDDIPF